MRGQFLFSLRHERFRPGCIILRKRPGSVYELDSQHRQQTSASHRAERRREIHVVKLENTVTASQSKSKVFDRLLEECPNRLERTESCALCQIGPGSNR